MGQTRYYSLAFFDFGDHLDSEPNPQREIERFVIIDKQIYGLYNIFGNGVIEGWNVSDATSSSEASGISVSIGPGLGIIKYMAAETIESDIITNLTANSILDVFAVLKGTTVGDRAVDFIVGLSGMDIDFGIRIATVQTGNNNVIYIDNTTRDLVGFKQLIKDAVDDHDHTGDMRIDLEDETKGQLPGARIAGIDADKITSGVFDIDRIPLKDHNDLLNNGMMTHAALDSFVQTLTQSNKELLGEINSVNMLKSVLFWKYLYPEVDEHFINELAIIPGISPNSYIDFVASTANINTDSHCISGRQAETGEIVSVLWDDQTSFYYNSYSKDTVIVEDDEVSLPRTGTEVDTIENFDYSIREGVSIPGFQKEITSTETIDVVADTSAEGKIEGTIAGRFNASANLKAIYTKELNPPRNWNGIYDELVLYVKTANQTHGAVYMQLVNSVDGVETVVEDWEIIAQDHVTINSNEIYHNFEEKKIDNISNYDLSNVTKLIFWTEDVSSDFTFYIDNIFVRKVNIVSPSGNIRFRHVAQTNVVFQSIIYDAEIPDGTDIVVKVKAANSSSLLPRSSFSNRLESGEIFSLSGTVCEIDVALTSTLEDTSPYLKSLELRMLVNSENEGLTIDQTNEWNRGNSFENVTVSLTGDEEYGDETADISLSSPINVGGVYYAYKDAVNEMDNLKIGQIGFSGNYIPFSPVQAADWANNPSNQFNYLSSVVRKEDKNFIIADTNNNRVIEVDRDGQVVLGFGSTYTTDTDLYPLSAIYNPETDILSIVFTKPVIVKDITKIVLYVGGYETTLSSDSTIINSQKAGGKILEISLSTSIVNKIIGVTSDFYVLFNDGAFAEDIVIKSTIQPIYGLRGMTVYVCNFTYIDGIRHPIFANALSNGDWIIANSSIIYTPTSTQPKAYTNTSQEDVSTTVPDIIEVSSTGENIFNSDAVKFSDFTIGSIYEYQSDKFVVSCIIEESGAYSGEITGEDLLNGVDASKRNDKLKFRAAAINALKDYRGQVVLIDKVNNRFQIIYSSPDGLYPTDIDMYDSGEFLIAESSFSDSSGRLIIIDGYGNVMWTFGNGSFNIINDAKVLENNHIMASL